MAMPQVVLQDIKISFEGAHLDAKNYWNSPASVWNSTTVTTLLGAMPVKAEKPVEVPNERGELPSEDLTRGATQKDIEWYIQSLCRWRVNNKVILRPNQLPFRANLDILGLILAKWNDFICYYVSKKKFDLSEIWTLKGEQICSIFTGRFHSCPGTKLADFSNL